MMGLPTCAEVASSMTDYMEGTLPYRKRLGIRVHMAMCDACTGLHQRLLKLSRLAKELIAPPAAAPPEARAPLDHVLTALKKDQGPDR